MENILGSLDGVVDVKADFAEGTARVTYNPDRVTPQQMVEAINTQTFYKASLPIAQVEAEPTETGVPPTPTEAPPTEGPPTRIEKVEEKEPVERPERGPNLPVVPIVAGLTLLVLGGVVWWTRRQ